jgi:methionine synthase II (cobalamin-independent)
VAEAAKRLPRATLVVQLDEPALPAVADGAVPTASGFGRLRVPDEEFLRDRLRQVTSATGRYTAIHCCSNHVAFGIIRGAGADAISLDISQLRTADYDEVAAAAEAGLGLFFGVAERPGLTAKGAADAVAELWRKLGLPPAQCSKQVVITPACGLAGSSPEQARDTLRRCQEAARILPELMGD